jgi:hypothetical protein
MISSAGNSTGQLESKLKKSERLAAKRGQDPAINAKAVPFSPEHVALEG